MSLRIGVAAEPASYGPKESLIKFLGSRTQSVIDFGVFDPDSEYDPQDLVDIAAGALKEKICDCCILMSVSGNGLQMYANKHYFIRAAPAFDPKLVSELIEGSRVNVIDIPTHLPLALINAIALEFVDIFGRRHALVR